MKRKHTVVLCLLAPALATQLLAQPKRPLQIADMFKIQRISDPALSPDGSSVAFTVTTPNLQENRNETDVWLASTSGREIRRLTTHPAHDRNPSWSPDGKWLAFESTRSGKSQVWLMSPDGGEPQQFTFISTEASQPVWSPDGKMLAYVSHVFPEFSSRPFGESDALNQKRLDGMESSKVKAKVITQLLYRHWDTWNDGRRKHIFVQPFEGPGRKTEPRNITPGERDAVPTSSTFSGGIDFAFSPDGQEIAYTATPTPVREEAWRTNHDIYTVPVSGGKPRQITTNPAADGFPRYSKDGKYIAYRAQSVPNFEADRWQLMLYERSTGTVRSLTAQFDASVASPEWAPDSKRLYFDAETEARRSLFTVSIPGNDVKKLFDKGTNQRVAVLPDGKKLLFMHQSAVRPVELYTVASDGERPMPVTRMNEDLFAQLDIPSPESIWYEGHGGTKIQSWVYKPPKMITNHKYPFVYMVHGGPQGAWEDGWHYRWNPALWAAQGYVVLAPNPRGSTGFGQEFVNEISNDWSGKVFVDLLKGLDYACKLPYVDSTKKAAAGASFGGYMMNWFATQIGGRFTTLVTHASVYNIESMYGTTEELWFDEWEHGMPWENNDSHEKHSPHVYAKNLKTPMLILHGERDFRVPISEAMQLFTALQRQGIPSKFIWFPDEGHGILKPANSTFWHETVFEWVGKYLRTGDAQQ